MPSTKHFMNSIMGGIRERKKAVESRPAKQFARRPSELVAFVGLSPIGVRCETAYFLPPAPSGRARAGGGAGVVGRVQRARSRGRRAEVRLRVATSAVAPRRLCLQHQLP